MYGRFVLRPDDRVLSEQSITLEWLILLLKTNNNKNKMFVSQEHILYIKKYS